MGRIVQITNENTRVSSITGLKNATITMNNGHILINGLEVDEYERMQRQKIDIHIHINGDVDSVENCESVEVTGAVGQISTMSGDVRCGDVRGSIKTMSGDVSCKSVAGNISSMSGDIDRRLED